MSLTEEIYSQAGTLLQNTTDVNVTLLELFCRSAENSLRQNLRSGITPEDCKADFVAAAGMLALAAMSEMDEVAQMEQIQTGDLTLRRGDTDSAARCLRHQAQVLMKPYLKDHFSFVGV